MKCVLKKTIPLLSYSYNSIWADDNRKFKEKGTEFEVIEDNGFATVKVKSNDGVIYRIQKEYLTFKNSSVIKI